MTKNDDKDKTLEQVLSDIEKQFGKGAVMRLGDNRHMDIDTCSSGSLSLDIALGIGGYPKGRIIEIFGPESSGKTTFALHAIAEIQKQGGRAAFIDAEHSLDPSYAKNLGVNINELLLSQPDTGEQALEICEALVRSEAINIVVIDSVAALVPKAEIDGEWHNLNDTADEDNDSDTLYKLPVKGFVIGVELYSSSTGTAKEKFEGIKTSYNADEDITTIFMSKDDYDFVYERRPNNKIHVYSLIIK